MLSNSQQQSYREGKWRIKRWGKLWCKVSLLILVNSQFHMPPLQSWGIIEGLQKDASWLLDNEVDRWSITLCLKWCFSLSIHITAYFCSGLSCYIMWEEKDKGLMINKGWWSHSNEICFTWNMDQELQHLSTIDDLSAFLEKNQWTKYR